MNGFEPGQERLHEAMRAWAAQTAPLEPPREVEAAVLRHFAKRPFWKRRGFGTAAVLGMPAAVAAVLAYVMLLPDREPVQPPAPAADAFIALPYVIQPAPNEPVEVVRAEVLAAELIAVGLPVNGDPNVRVEADILVGQDGRARAVRLVSESEMGVSE